jgi:hypothetical protein
MITYFYVVNKHHTNNVEANNIEFNMQHDYNTWKSLLEASGGQLAPENEIIIKLNGTFKQSENQSWSWQTL